MFGLPLGLSVATRGDGRDASNPEALDTLSKAYAAIHAANQTPNGRVSRGFNQFGPQASQPASPMLPTPPTPGPVNMGAPADAAAPGALSGIGGLAAGAKALMAPSPAAGPTSVGGAPLTGTPAQWETVGGNPNGPPVGPTSVGGAPLAYGPTSVGGAPLVGGLDSLGPKQASGPDVIDKLLSFFHSKDNPDT